MKQLNELKVIELASVLAGPLVGSFFAEAGARVIKYEKTGEGDITRQWKLASEKKGDVSAYFSAANYGKAHDFIDLNKESELEKLLSEMQTADILICNFKHGDAEKFHLTPEFLSKRFPTLIQGYITGFPDSPERSAFDIVLQAETGFLSMTGSDETNLAKMPVALIDVLAAHQLKEGLLIALMQREQTKKGSLVSVSLYEAALASLANQASSWLMRQALPKPYGLLHPSISPYGETLRCTDGKILVLAVGNNKQFASLCEVLNKTGLATDPLFANNPERVKNRILLQEQLQKAAGKFASEELFSRLTAAKVPVGRIFGIDEVFANPGTQNLVLESVIDGEQTKRVSGNVFRIHPYPIG